MEQLRNNCYSAEKKGIFCFLRCCLLKKSWTSRTTDHGIFSEKDGVALFQCLRSVAVLPCAKMLVGQKKISPLLGRVSQGEGIFDG